MRNKKIKFAPFWKKNNLVLKLFNIFGEKNIKLVGGAVRCALRKKYTNDLDLAVNKSPEQVKRILKKNNINFFDKSKGHGTVSIVFNDYNIEITSLREDIETYGRSAKVIFTNSFEIDSMRRDFTINAIFSDFDGNLYDPQNGIDDLSKNTIKFIGDAEKRISEDFLRILRYFRMLSSYSYSNKHLDEKSLKAAIKCFHKIRNLSKERILNEFQKLILSDNANFSLSLMKKNKLLDYLIKDLQKVKTQYLMKIIDLPNNFILRIAYLILVSDLKLDEIKKNLKISNSVFFQLKNISANKTLITSEIQAKKIKYFYGKEVTLTNYKLLNFINNKKNKKYILKIINNWEAPKFPLSGKDIIKYKSIKGKDIGSLLKCIEEWWIDKNFIPNKKECIKQIEISFLGPRG